MTIFKTRIRPTEKCLCPPLGAALKQQTLSLNIPCPKQSTRAINLWKKYKAVTEYLSQKGHDKKIDDQLYYNLVIRSYLMESKLSQ